MNQLYPIFLKPENISFLIIGGGVIAEEKLDSILKSSPRATLKMVAKNFSDSLKIKCSKHGIKREEKDFEKNDVKGFNVAIIAINNRFVSKEIRGLLKNENILCNVADTPDLCDFYLASIVSKGDMKIAISTNGKAPGLSKRLRLFFEDIFPNEIQSVIENIDSIRKSIKNDFQKKVATVNKLTKAFKE